MNKEGNIEHRMVIFWASSRNTLVTVSPTGIWGGAAAPPYRHIVRSSMPEILAMGVRYD